MFPGPDGVALVLGGRGLALRVGGVVTLGSGQALAPLMETSLGICGRSGASLWKSHDGRMQGLPIR